MKLKVAELSGALASAKVGFADANEALRTKDAEIAKLQSAFKEKQELVERHGFHYRKGKDGKPQGKPYCPRCLQDGRLYMTHQALKTGRPVCCPNCKTEYQQVTVFAFED